MIHGSVNARYEATITLQVSGPTGQHRDITAVIDTGFNGALSLPRAVVASLSLTAIAPRTVTLGDGSRTVLDYYDADVLWDLQPNRIRVLCVEGVPLLGTALLRGHKLEVEFEAAGSVTVSALP